MNEKDKFDMDQWEGRPAQEQASEERPMTAREVLERQIQKHAKDFEAIIATPDPIPKEPENPTGNPWVLGIDPAIPPTPKSTGPIVQRSSPIRYRDADEFDQEVQAGDLLHGSSVYPDNTVIIRHLDSDRQYKLPRTEASRRGLRPGDHRYRDRETVRMPDAPICGRCGGGKLYQETHDYTWKCAHCGQQYTDTQVKSGQVVRTDLTQAKIHIFDQGGPLCNFTSLRPVDWPKGHERISLADAQRGVRFTCNECAKLVLK